MKMKKHLLVGAALLGAMSFGSAATALEVDGVATVGGVDITTDPYPLAQEADVSLLAGSSLNVEIAPSTGTLPNGNLFFNITLANAVFDGALNGNTVFATQGTCAPVATINQGGGDGGSTVRFAISGLDTCDGGANSIVVNVPFESTGGNVSAAYLVTLTDGSTQLDGGVLNVDAVTEIDAFSASLVGDGSGPEADVNAAGGAYLQFVGATLAGDLGDFDVDVDTAVYKDLAGNLVAATDIDAITVTLTGNFGAFASPAPGGMTIGSAVGDVGASSAEFTFTQLGTGDAGTVAEAVADAAVTATADDATPIAATNVSGSIEIELDPAFYEAQSAQGGALDAITRNGSSETLPWTASATQAAGTGSTTFVRVSNPTTDSFGAISARVLSSTNGATVGAEGQLAATLAAGGEALFTSQDLENILGNFGRGDIEIVVEGEGAFITRLLQRPDGTLEINNRD